MKNMMVLVGCTFLVTRTLYAGIKLEEQTHLKYDSVRPWVVGSGEVCRDILGKNR